MQRSLSLALLLALSSSVQAAVEVIIGKPVTEHVSEPFSVDFDSKGTLYGVEFTKSNRVFKLEQGKLEFIAGVPYASDEKALAPQDVMDGSDPQNALFKGMHDIAITPEGKAIIADSFHNLVRVMDLKTGAISTLAGTGKAGFGGDGGPALQASFIITMCATISPDQQRLYIADIGNHRTREIDLASGIVRTVAGNGRRGNPTDEANALETPMGDTRAVVQAEDGTLFVLLRGGNSLVAVKDGKARTVVNASGQKGLIGDGGNGRDAQMNGPKYVSMDKSGRVLICDTENHCLRRFDPKTGKIELIAGEPGKAGDKVGKDGLSTQLRRPHGVRVGPDGLLYIADTYNNRVLRLKYD
jgi:DNA-binding beta-propeller fold protein YncE